MGGRVDDSGPSGAVSCPAEDLPSVEALEAEQEKERRETNDLLAAFDRPARGAKRPAPSGGPGFVEYYASKAEVARERGPERRNAPRRAADVATVVRPPPLRRSVPAWLFWAVASAAMIAIGTTAAVLTTGDPPHAAARTTASTVRPAAAPVAPVAAASGRDEVPLPDPAPATTPPAVAAPSAAPPRSLSSAPASGSAPARRPVHDPTPAPLPRTTDDGPVRQL